MVVGDGIMVGGDDATVFSVSRLFFGNVSFFVVDCWSGSNFFHFFINSFALSPTLPFTFLSGFIVTPTRVVCNNDITLAKTQ